MIKVNLETGLATREPVPYYLPNDVEALSDLAKWADPAFGLHGFGWWPEDDKSPALGEFERYGVERLTVDPARRVVIVERVVQPWSAEEIAAYQAEQAAAAESDPANRMTVLALRNRFTQAEKVAIEMASLDNPAATLEARTFAAGLRAMMADLNAASHVNRLRKDTRDGVIQIEAAAVIGPGRALIILDAPIEPHERYTGA